MLARRVSAGILRQLFPSPRRGRYRVSGETPMSDTYHAINLHFVFGTKSRAPLITDKIRFVLFPYIGGVARN